MGNMKIECMFDKEKDYGQFTETIIKKLGTLYVCHIPNERGETKSRSIHLMKTKGELLLVTMQTNDFHLTYHVYHREIGRGGGGGGVRE